MNQVKDTSAPLVPIDTNYLHGFSKVKISFLGTLEYFDSSHDRFSYSNSIDSVGQYTIPIVIGRQTFKDFYVQSSNGGGEFFISWKGNFFFINGKFYGDTTYSWNGNPYTKVYTSAGKSFSIFGSISGNQIDSICGSYQSAFDDINFHFEKIDTTVQYLEMNRVPISSQSSDTLSFSAIGSLLKPLLGKLRDRSCQIYNDLVMINELKQIKWDSNVQPILSIKFYK